MGKVYEFLLFPPFSFSSLVSLQVRQHVLQHHRGEREDGHEVGVLVARGEGDWSAHHRQRCRRDDARVWRGCEDGVCLPFFNSSSSPPLLSYPLLLSSSFLCFHQGYQSRLRQLCCHPPYLLRGACDPAMIEQSINSRVVYEDYFFLFFIFYFLFYFI